MSENQEFAGDVLPVGYMISGRYRIESCLGSGGMGAVYLAHDKVLEGSSVAMKVLHREVAHDEIDRAVADPANLVRGQLPGAHLAALPVIFRTGAS